jgi:hypothetical protein
MIIIYIKQKYKLVEISSCHINIGSYLVTSNKKDYFNSSKLLSRDRPLTV